MDITPLTQTVGVIGHPIGHSLSPRLHNSLYKKLKLDMVYLAFDVKPADLERAVHGMTALGFRGFNVTIPHKGSMLDLVDEIDPEAQLIGAVNTVKLSNGKLVGYNTDGQGFMESLRRNYVSIRDKHIVILGAGGAARAVSMAVAAEHPKRMTIVNRTFERGRQLAGCVNDAAGRRLAEAVSEIPLDANVIINTTPLGMWPDINKNPISGYNLRADTVVCDIVYNPRKTMMLQQAEAMGCKTVDGLGMLIGQALRSIEIWTDRKLDSGAWNLVQEEIGLI